MNNIFIKPVITEKAMNSVGNNKYTFIVARNAKKDAIKKAIEKIFTVHVIGVMTTIIKGKSLRVGAKRTQKNISPVKKAMVVIKAGEKIGLFESNK